MSTDREYIECQLRNMFEAELSGRVERYARVKVHPVIPHGFFSAASSECRDLFVACNFYGCITLAQSVAEGLAKFIAEKKGLGVVKDYRSQVNILQKDRANPAISNAAYAAFRKIHGDPKEDRNDFHHLNKLEARAEECIHALYDIESDLFAFESPDGTLHPKCPEFWPPSGPDTTLVYVRSG
jgi:hypothetical protein